MIISSDIHDFYEFETYLGAEKFSFHPARFSAPCTTARNRGNSMQQYRTENSRYENTGKDMKTGAKAYSSTGLKTVKI